MGPGGRDGAAKRDHQGFTTSLRGGQMLYVIRHIDFFRPEMLTAYLSGDAKGVLFSEVDIGKYLPRPVVLSS